MRDAIALGDLERVYPLLDLLQVGFVLVDAAGEIKYATGPALRLLQVRRLDRATFSEILGAQREELLTPIFTQTAWTTRWRERRAHAPHGEELELAMRSVAIDAPDGVIHALVAIYDVSAEIGLHRRYKALLARQEAINDELRQRIATELRAHEDDVAQFSELLAVAPAIFTSFRVEAEAAVRALTQVGAGYDDDAVVVALRESHTLKGNARGLGLHYIAGRAHAVEDLLGAARAAHAPPDAGVLDGAIADLRRAMERAVSLRGGLEGGGGDGGAVEARAAALDELAGVLGEARDALADHPARAHVLRALASVERMARVPLSQLLHYLRITARSVAAAAGRDEPMLEVRGDELAVPARIHAALQTALPHLVRNAIVHGLEPAAERARAGKAAAGMITLAIRVDDPELVVTIADDGRGVDRAKLAGGDADATLDALVFRPGLSSRAAADLDAGRGLGAAAARDAIAAIGGTLTIASTPGEGTTFEARFAYSAV